MSALPESGPDLLPSDGWEESRGRLVAFVRRRLGDPEEAEDVVHEVFVRALERAESLADTKRVDAWLYQITRNVLIDRHRSGAAAARALESYGAEEAPPLQRDSVDADATSARSELAGCLRPLIDGLPTPYRHAVSLSTIEGHRQRDVADRLGLSVSGAKSRIQRGREMLRERLLACCAVERDRRGGVVEWERRGPEACGTDGGADCGSC